LGYTKQQAKEKIGAVVIEDIYDILKFKENFDEAKYTKILNELK